MTHNTPLLPRLRLTLLVLLVSVLAWSLCAPCAANAKTAVFVSEEWEDATNADGSGFYWDILRAVFEPAGYDLTLKVMPYARAVKTVLDGQADGWVGSYVDEEAVVYPKTAYDADTVAGIFPKGSLDPSKGQKALENKNVGWIRGYSYDDYLDVPVQKNLVNARENGMQMVERGRLDVFLDAKYDIDAAMEKGVVDPAAVDIATFMELKLYLAFTNTDKGRELAGVWDKRMQELHDSGELKKLYEASDYTDFYPF